MKLVGQKIKEMVSEAINVARVRYRYPLHPMSPTRGEEAGWGYPAMIGRDKTFYLDSVA